MAYVLGLDLGTSSIGAAAILLDESGIPKSLLDHHVYLFKEPVVNEQGTLISKKASRRNNRQMRKQRDRRNGRLQHLLSLCQKNFGTSSAQTIVYDDVVTMDVKRFQGLALRAHAVESPIHLSDMTAVVLHLSKSRGYSSGFKPLSKAAQEKLSATQNIEERTKILAGDVQPGHERLRHIMARRGCITVGQYLLDRAKRGLPSILKSSDRAYVSVEADITEEEIEIIRDKKTDVELSRNYHNLYALRDDIKTEFERIWHTQATYHPELTPALFELFYSVLFYQRPLKSVQAMVGGCLVEPTLPRAARAHPAFQTFRIEKQLADLRWGYGRNAKHLSVSELNIIRSALHDPEKLNASAELSFSKIYELLTPLRGEDAPKCLNLANGGREGLTGNVTNKRWHGLGLYSVWQQLAKRQADDKPHTNRQTWVINFLSDLGSIEALFAQNWQDQFTLSDLPARNKKTERRNQQAAMFKDQLFIAFIDQFRNHEKCDRLSSLKFDSGRASYSIKALNKINGWLDEKIQFSGIHVDEYQAIEALYAQSKAEQKISHLLDNPTKVGNGVVDVALMQVKKVVNHFIVKHGKPQRIVVEMAREMGEGLTRRNETQKNQIGQNKSHKLAAHDMSEKNVPYSKTNVLRFRLANDQGYGCPYCGKKLGAAEIYDGSATNIEHIVPQSITQVARKYSEIVLAHRHCNDKKGKRVPMEAFAFNVAYISEMAQRLRSLKQGRKALLLEMPETPANVIDDALLNDFCERQFHETAWITKLTATWLRSLGINVECTRGMMTAQLRAQWGLDSVIPEVRIAENLPVYSTNTPSGEMKETIVPTEALFDSAGNRTLLWKYWDQQALTPDECAELRKTGLYRYDKRCDHRHHLIDAITIGLCDRSMVKHMAEEYKKRSEQEAKKIPELRRNVKFGRMPCPILDLRSKVLQAVREQRVTHRPDRLTSGAWFQEHGYGLYTDRECENQQFIVIRSKVRELIGKDDSATTANIKNVVGVEVRKSLEDSYEEFKRLCWNGGTPKSNDEYKTAMEQLWLTPPHHLRLHHPIIKVKQKKDAYSLARHVLIEHGIPDAMGKLRYKILIAYVKAFITWNPKNSGEEPIVVSNFSARNGGQFPRHWRRVCKGDTVIAKNGLRYVVKGLNESNNRIETMRIMCASAGLKGTQKEGRQDFSLTKSTRAGSMSLWDIVGIEEDPFNGRPTCIDD